MHSRVRRPSELMLMTALEADAGSPTSAALLQQCIKDACVSARYPQTAETEAAGDTAKRVTSWQAIRNNSRQSLRSVLPVAVMLDVPNIRSTPGLSIADLKSRRTLGAASPSVLRNARESGSQFVAPHHVRRDGYC